MLRIYYIIVKQTVTVCMQFTENHSRESLNVSAVYFELLYENFTGMIGEKIPPRM